MPSNTAVCPCRPSMPGATIMLTSSTKPASRKPPQICPPPTTASRSTPNYSPSMSIARDKSIQSRPVVIHEMPCSRKCSKYSSVTFSLVIQSNGCPSASPEAQRNLPRVSVIMVYSPERLAICTDSFPTALPLGGSVFSSFKAGHSKAAVTRPESLEQRPSFSNAI